MNVVTNVIRTNIAKIVGGRICISYPMVSMTNSISPRVFNKAPMQRLSCQFSPLNRAASNAPPNFPKIATNVNIPHIIQLSGVLSNPISVRNPVDTKKRGRKSANETSSTFSVIILRNLIFAGMTTPAINAPKRTCRPNTSVIYAEIISIKNIKATMVLSTTSLL